MHRLRARVRNKLGSLIQLLKRRRPVDPLAELDWTRLDVRELLLLVTLLKASFESKSPYLSGRHLLQRTFDNTYDALRSLRLLSAEGTLRQLGAIVPEVSEEGEDLEADPADVLRTRFRLAGHVLAAFSAEANGAASANAKQQSPTPYLSNRDLLVDLRILGNLYRARSQATLSRGRWNRTHADGARLGQAAGRRLRALSNRIRARLEATSDAKNFPAVRFQWEFGLDEEAMVLVVHLLFQELYDGDAFADAVELMRMVSRDERDLIRKRHLITAGSPLIEHEILVVEDMIEGRPMTAEAHLASWVVNRVLGDEVVGDKIGSDERLDFHLYLHKLDSARTFFRDLEG
jgi:hypothetical protein